MNKTHESDIEQNTTSIERENLLKENPDLVFGVYRYVGEDENELETELIENALTCYKNQYENGNIKGLDENPEIHLLDLWEYQQGRIVYLRKGTSPELNLKEGKKHQGGEICYLSAGAHEIYLPNKKTGVKHINFTVTERDSGAGDKGMYTIVAGRAIGTDINKETIREYIEERVSLGKDGFFYIPQFTKNDISLKEKEEILVQAIKSFVENKLANIQTYKDSVFEKIFGTNKKDFIQKLENIANGNEKPKLKEFYLIDTTKKIKNDFFSLTIGKNIKRVNGDYFHIVYDERTGGFECKKIYINIFLNNGIIPLGQFFSESSNQRPKITTSDYVLNIEKDFLKGKINDPKKYVPYFITFIKQVQEVKNQVLSLIEVERGNFLEIPLMSIDKEEIKFSNPRLKGENIDNDYIRNALKKIWETRENYTSIINEMYKNLNLTSDKIRLYNSYIFNNSDKLIPFEWILNNKIFNTFNAEFFLDDKIIDASYITYNNIKKDSNLEMHLSEEKAKLLAEILWLEDGGEGRFSGIISEGKYIYIKYKNGVFNFLIPEN